MYSLLNGELVLLRSENAPFETSLMGAVVSLDGDLVAIYNSYGNHYIWDSATSISQVQPLEHIDRHDYLSISSDGRYIYALAARRNSCRIVDLHNTRLHARNMASGNRKRCISVSADLSTVAIAEIGDHQVVVTAYRVSDGLESFRRARSSSCFNSFALSANGELLLLCYTRNIELWDRNICIGYFGDQLDPRPNFQEFEAGTISMDRSYVIGVGSLHTMNDYLIMVYNVESSTPPIVINAHWSSWQRTCGIKLLHIDDNLDIYIVCRTFNQSDAVLLLEHRVWSAAPKEVELSTTPPMPNEQFTLHRDGWVTRFDDGSGTLERLCWIPPSRRNGKDVRFHGHILPLLSDSGEFSVFDLSAFEENAM